MNSYPLLITLAAVIYVTSVRCNFLSLMEDNIGRAIGIEFTNFQVRSHMLCAAECIKRKRCKFFGHKGKKCGFKNTAILSRVSTCREVREFVSMFPKALAGACADHNCSLTQACKALTGGGYTCKKG